MDDHRVFHVPDVSEDCVDGSFYAVSGKSRDDGTGGKGVADIIHQEIKEKIQGVGIVQFVSLDDVFHNNSVVCVRKIGFDGNFFERKPERKTAVTQIIEE